MKKIIAVNGDPALQNANRVELVVALAGIAGTGGRFDGAFQQW